MDGFVGGNPPMSAVHTIIDEIELLQDTTTYRNFKRKYRRAEYICDSNGISRDVALKYAVAKSFRITHSWLDAEMKRLFGWPECIYGESYFVSHCNGIFLDIRYLNTESEFEQFARDTIATAANVAMIKCALVIILSDTKIAKSLASELDYPYLYAVHDLLSSVADAKEYIYKMVGLPLESHNMTKPAIHD